MNIPSFFKNKQLGAVTASILWGGFFSLSLINLWSYFWRRSFLVQFLLLDLIIAVGASLFFLSLKRISRFFNNITKKEKLSLIISSSIVSMLLAIILFPFTPLSPNLTVPHKLKIRAMDDNNPASRSSAVILLEIKINGKKVHFTALEQSGDWVLEEEAIRSRGQATLTYVFRAKWDSTVEILFEKGPSAGLAQIEYDDQAPIVKDLYSAEVGDRLFSPPSSLTNNKVSLLFVTLLFIVEYCISFWLILIYLTLMKVISPELIQQILKVSPFILFGLFLAYYQFQANFGFDKINGGWQYFTGSEGAIKAYGPVITYGGGTGDRSDVFHCLEILKKVPGSAQVLNLNGFAAVEPCLFSPLLPQDKIVHHYEALAITEPYYQTLMFGEPQAAYKIYQDLGINYFYIRKGDMLFVNLGYSRALEPQNLEQYFDVYAESPDFYILTWRGDGLYPVSPQLAREISIWYNHGKDKKYNTLNFWWLGREGLEDWVQTQP